MDDSIAWKNGQWIPKDQVHLALDDWGFVQGVVIVDRLRTINLVALDLNSHLQRLQSNCVAIGIQIDIDEIGQVIETCVVRNRQTYGGNDFSIVVLVTPGLMSASAADNPEDRATVIVHTQAINWRSLAHWYANGQCVLLAPNRNVPSDCWSPHLKTRARLQYYLADQHALKSGLPYAGAILLDINGKLTETSAANLILVGDNHELIVPLESETLAGISLARTLQLAHESGLTITRRSIQLEDVRAAREALLTGTTGCLWPAKQLADTHFSNPTERDIYRELKAQWCKSLGLNYVDQANRMCK